MESDASSETIETIATRIIRFITSLLFGKTVADSPARIYAKTKHIIINAASLVVNKQCRAVRKDSTRGSNSHSFCAGDFQANCSIVTWTHSASKQMRPSRHGTGDSRSSFNFQPFTTLVVICLHRHRQQLELSVRKRFMHKQSAQVVSGS